VFEKWSKVKIAFLPVSPPRLAPLGLARKFVPDEFLLRGLTFLRGAKRDSSAGRKAVSPMEGRATRPWKDFFNRVLAPSSKPLPFKLRITPPHQRSMLAHEELPLYRLCLGQIDLDQGKPTASNPEFAPL